MISNAYRRLREGLAQRVFACNKSPRHPHAESSDSNASNLLSIRQAPIILPNEVPKLDSCTRYGRWDRLKTIRSKGHADALPIFLTIPLEIRLLIYEFALGDSHLIANKCAAPYYSPPWDSAGCTAHTYNEIKRHQIMLTCQQCYEEGHPVFYGMTSWLVQSPDAALWELENPVSAFWTHANLVKEMRICGNEGVERLRLADFPALQRLVVRLHPSRPYDKLVHDGTILEMPAPASSDQEIITWVMATTQYKRSVKDHFQSQRKFIISVEMMFGWLFSGDNLFCHINLDNRTVVRSVYDRGDGEWRRLLAT